MRFTFRLNLALVIGVVSVSLGVATYQIRAETTDLERNLERHALTLAESLSRSVHPLVVTRAQRDLQRIVDEFANRERIAAIAVYTAAGFPLVTTTGIAAMTASGTGPNVIVDTLADGRPRGEFFQTSVGRVHVVAIALRSETGPLAALAIFHDANYISDQGAKLWRWALGGIMLQTLLIVYITLFAVRWGVSRPLSRMAHWIRESRLGTKPYAAAVSAPSEFQHLNTELVRVATSLQAARAAAQEEALLRTKADAQWTTERLRIFVQGRLEGKRLIVVSNREPFEHLRTSNGVECVIPASGLVTALDPVMRTCDGTWIAQATGDADRETADQQGRLRVPPDHPQYTLRRVWLSKEEEQGFYLGFANEGLWPLCHIAHTRPTFRANDWEQYRRVNEKFAEVVLDELAGEDSPVVLIQDYHFALLPKLIKDRRPDAKIAIFWHIPWPNPEAFGICPWQRELLEGLLGADLVGFHIQAHCNNFLDTADRALESRIERERFAVHRNGRNTLVRPFPISVAMDSAPAAPRSELPHVDRSELFAKLGVRAAFMAIGVDRVDYTKGIPERFRAVERFLETYPSYRTQFTLVQIGSPSRTDIPRYHDLMEEVRQESERINRRFQTNDWRPIVFLNRQHSHAEILPYYQAANVCLVTSLHDGMNLVAKEFIASRDDDEGVLILSRFAGASHELADALIVNPYDTDAVAEAIHTALDMPDEERTARIRRMRSQLRERNIYWWAGHLIDELCQVKTPARFARPKLVRANVG